MPIDVPQQARRDEKAFTRVQRYIEIVASAGLGAFILWKGVLSIWPLLGSDFPQYYIGAKLVVEHYNLDRIYDWIWFQRISDHFGVHHQLVGFSGLTPFCAVPLLPLAWLDVLQAKHVWVLLNIGLLIAVVHLLSRTCDLPLRRTWLIALLAALPLRNDFALGQMHLVVFALLVIGWRFHMRGEQVASGCCIALAGALKIYPLFYCFYFLLKKRWRALGAVAATTVACGALCLILLGETATTAFLGRQLPRLMNGEAIDPFSAVWTSASAMFHRIFLFDAELNPHPLVSSPFLYAVFYSLWQALLAAAVVSRLRWAFRPDDRETIEWCAFLTLLMFLSSAPSTYHFVALIGAAVPTYAIVERILPRFSWPFLAIYAVACNARNIVPRGPLPTAFVALLVPKLWAGVVLIVFYIAVLALCRFQCAKLGKAPSGGTMQIAHERFWQSTTYAVFGVLFPVLWLVGFASTRAHLKSMGMNHSRNIMEADGAAMRTEPQTGSHGPYYVAMLEPEYKVLHDGVPVRDVSTGDELSYSTDREGKHLWIETATVAGSEIAEVDTVNGDRAGCEINDAESPALSQDGDSLAFVREEHGHGGLWIADPHNCSPSGQQVRVTPPGIDVRSVNGAPKGSFVFSAMTAQGSGVFLVSRNTGPEMLLQLGADVDSLAISSDAGTIILSTRIAGYSQLLSYSLRTHITRQLTKGGCNATTPWWEDVNTVIYATDCGRGMGLSTLAEANAGQ